MIVLGLTSGLSSIGYSVIDVAPTVLEQIDCDVLAGTRMKSVNIWRRCNAHRLVLSIVLERATPAVIALGPAVTRAEPEEYLLAMRTMMESIASLIRVPVLRLDSESEIVGQLAVDGAAVRQRRLTGLVSHHLGGPLYSTDRRVVLATATALAAAFEVRKQQKGVA